jgi:type IV secretion system protein VirD4
MVSRQETARPLLTPGEVMQLPPTDEIVMVAGISPVRAKKVRYYEDRRLQDRVLPPPSNPEPVESGDDEWSTLPLPPKPTLHANNSGSAGDEEDTTDSERRRQPELSRVRPVEKKEPIENEFEIDPIDDDQEEAARNSRMSRTMQRVARQVSLDPKDGMEL